MPDEPIEIDALIVGGGVTGLWLRAVLKEYGRSVVLIESAALGTGQTIASQGIVHNGAKYAAQSDSLKELIWSAPVLAHAWKLHLSGKNIPDLSSTTVVSRESWYWNPDGPLPDCLNEWWDEHHPRDDGRSDPPSLLDSVAGEVRRNDEWVISPAPLLANLAGQFRQDLLLVQPGELDVELDSPGIVRSVTLRHPSGERMLTVKPRHVYLAAGAGNAAIRQSVELEGDASMQRRPLQMAMLRGELPTLCGHWFDQRGPRLTVSTQFDANGRTIWLLGGRLAEQATEEPGSFLSRTRQEVQAGLPNISLTGMEWSSYTAVRAEPSTSTMTLPTEPHLTLEGNVLTLWPVKLTLVPGLMIDLRRALDEAGVRNPAPLPLPDWPRPEIATPPWQTAPDWIPDRDVARAG